MVACRACRRGKVRCVRTRGRRCERCERLGIACVSQVKKQGRPSDPWSNGVRVVSSRIQQLVRFGTLDKKRAHSVFDKWVVASMIHGRDVSGGVLNQLAPVVSYDVARAERAIESKILDPKCVELFQSIESSDESQLVSLVDHVFGQDPLDSPIKGPLDML